MKFCGKTFCVLAVFVIIFLMGGCIRMSGHTNQERALQYLEGKYGDKFTLYSSIDDSVDQRFREYYFVAEAFPGQIVKVIEDVDGYRDNYYGFLVKEDFGTMVQPVWDHYFPDGKVFWQFSGSTFPDGLDRHTDLSKAMRDYEEALRANFVLFADRDALTDSMWQEMVHALVEKHVHGLIRYYRVDPADYPSLTEDSYPAYLSENYRLEPVYHGAIK